MDVLMSPECEAYESFARSKYPDDPFPMTKNKLIRYIKFRARCKTFFSFMSNLDKHPLHGEPWLNKMNNDPDVRHLMQLSLNLWPREAKECKVRLIGVDYVNPVPVRNSALHAPHIPKKRGYMVTDTESTTTNHLNQGHTPDAPIDLNNYHHVPTMSFTPPHHTSHYAPNNLATLVARFKPDPKPYVMKKKSKKPIEPPLKRATDKPKRAYRKRPVYIHDELGTKIKEPVIRIERPTNYTMKDVVVVISRPELSLATIPTFILQRYMKGEVSEGFLKEYLKGFIEEEEDPKQTTLDQFFTST
ncbi:uncharacterized protein B0P05DRAFT_596124 [Gilbertella persicaria]|uniref:uncharacterized protein n=1 Tax=Gilbertella persicaria TaxID=101096 RepID=UPI0022201BBE|nr:uncharacterized protein B0P05DRAFT_596124 [Gilbertella persicaria]KAI8081807.1 hypothetical protein B0P05DRAFT_596124 [Gilbertella persicaria]